MRENQTWWSTIFGSIVREIVVYCWRSGLLFSRRVRRRYDEKTCNRAMCYNEGPDEDKKP